MTVPGITGETGRFGLLRSSHNGDKMGAIIYDLVTGQVYGTGDADDPMNPELGYINPFVGDFIAPPAWYTGPSQWYWAGDGDVHWWQEGEAEPIKPFDIDDAKTLIEALELDAANCEADRSAMQDSMSSMGDNVAALMSVPVRSMSAEGIFGLSWEFDSSDTSRILVRAGRARASDDSADILLSNNSYLSLNSVGAGALDAGTKAANSLYWIWLIDKNNGDTSLILSTSQTSPVMPATYTRKRLIGFIFTSAGASTVQMFHVEGSGLDVRVQQSTNHAVGSSTAAMSSLDCSRICPDLTRMPVVFGNVTALSALGVSSVFDRQNGSALFSTESLLVGTKSCPIVPLDSQRRAWYGSSLITLNTRLSIQGGSFSRRVL